MKKVFKVLISLFLTIPAFANDGVELSQVTTGEEHGHFTATLQFNTPVAAEEVRTDLLKDALDITIPNTKLLGDKNFVDVAKQDVKSISSTANGNDVVTKVIFAKGFTATKDSYRVVSTGDQIKILFRKPGQEWSLAALGIDGITPISLDGAATPETKEENIAINTSAAATATASTKEADIPVLIGANKKEQGTKSPFSRLFMSLGVIAVLAIGLVQFSKWWQKRHGKTTDNTKIRMLTQHHLGPKKSLAIIRVAGETILIGVTDHNISMIKTLALLEDEEVPELVPQSFAGEMQKKGAAAKNEDDENDSAFAQIRDRISTRIKEMRPL